MPQANSPDSVNLLVEMVIQRKVRLIAMQPIAQVRAVAHPLTVLLKAQMIEHEVVRRSAHQNMRTVTRRGVLQY